MRIVTQGLVRRAGVLVYHYVAIMQNDRKLICESSSRPDSRFDPSAQDLHVDASRTGYWLLKPARLIRAAGAGGSGGKGGSDLGSGGNGDDDDEAGTAFHEGPSACSRSFCCPSIKRRPSRLARSIWLLVRACAFNYNIARTTKGPRLYFIYTLSYYQVAMEQQRHFWQQPASRWINFRQLCRMQSERGR